MSDGELVPSNGPSARLLPSNLNTFALGVAATTPAATPTPMAKSMAETVSSKVLGKRASISSSTGVWPRMDLPRSPWAAF